MATVTLTMEFSGFVNVQDTWIIGADDSKAGTIGTYELPEGYSVAKNSLGELMIYDNTDAHCEIVTNRASGRPQLLSGAKSDPVLMEVRVEA